eukprot:1794518-Amphidinium_carterae.1
MLNNFGALEGNLLQKATRGILKGPHLSFRQPPKLQTRATVEIPKTDQTPKTPNDLKWGKCGRKWVLGHLKAT